MTIIHNTPLRMKGNKTNKTSPLLQDKDWEYHHTLTQKTNRLLAQARLHQETGNAVKERQTLNTLKAHLQHAIAFTRDI